jgi:RND family efflux transporter MFP subunit
MNEYSRRRPLVVWLGVTALAVALVVIGMLAGTLWTERRLAAGVTGSASPTTVTVPAGGHAGHGGGPARSEAVPGAGEALEVSISQEAARRAGIKLVEARPETVKSVITVPATVASNAYRDTKVNALVGGIVRDVSVELGTSVSRGQSIAVVFSNELAEAQMKYLSLRAMLHADDQKLERTRRLTEIGAASRQELDEMTAAQAARATEVAAARQRLYLLGLGRDQVDRLIDASQIISELHLVAPADGLLIARNVNPGQVITAGQELFVVTDLSTVWVIGDLYEKDFGVVRVGTPATVTVGGGQRLVHGHVAYIDPRVDAATRTAKVRVEVPNKGSELRLGMFVQVTFETPVGGTRVVVPRAAVQMIGERTVVYVATDAERFQERTVSLGAAAGDAVEIASGLKPGERVVSEGSFFVRAEAGRARGAG